MDEIETFPGNEVAKVQSELIAFRDEYLPVFLERMPRESITDYAPDFIREQAVNNATVLPSWQQAISKVGESLPICANGQDVPPLETADFEAFMFQAARPSFSQTEIGIRWRISLFIPLDWEYCVGWPPFLPQLECGEDRARVFVEMLPEIKQWLMSLDVPDNTLLNALCTVLPYIADVDPAFAKLALDLETWHAVVRADPDLTDDVRRRSLRAIDHGIFPRAVNNALLHVFAALGNTHFFSIRDYLDHPCLYGSYTGLMPHYLFALLFQKILTLQDLVAHGGGSEKS